MSTLQVLFTTFASITLTFIGYFLGRSKMKAEVSKLLAETQTISDNQEISLSNFYKKAVIDLMEDVKSLREEIENERSGREECHDNIEKLREEYKNLHKQMEENKFLILNKA